ncbi:MAG TPA: glycogen-binding domain-containing protein [Dongiaceae bacterium]|jgi:1,4-alpha-glucan branching enzyme|nr:glycogen-binding domain-containing protein [Dongiaceae bacterium]
MKKSARKNPGPGRSGLLQVNFEFTDPGAASVALAGTFNDWRAAATPMIPLGAGRWAKALVLPPGNYEYRLVVDGHWQADPGARESVPNPYGGTNSVRRVTPQDDADVSGDSP